MKEEASTHLGATACDELAQEIQTWHEEVGRRSWVMGPPLVGMASLKDQVWPQLSKILTQEIFFMECLGSKKPSFFLYL